MNATRQDHALSRGDWLRALAVVVIWGLNFVVMKVGLQGLSPMLLGALRFSAASLPFLLFARMPALPWRFVAAYGLAQGLGQFGFLFLGLQLGMTAGMASVVMQMQAFFTLLLVAPLLGERARTWQWLGLLVALGGLVMIGMAHGEGPGQMTLIGFILTACAAFMWAVWTDGWAQVTQQVRALDMAALLSVAYLALLATLLAYTLWTRLLQRHPAGKVTPFSLLVPVVGLAAAGVFFGEVPLPLQWAGTAAVLLGLLVNQAGAWVAARWADPPAAHIKPFSANDKTPPRPTTM